MIFAYQLTRVAVVSMSIPTREAPPTARLPTRPGRPRRQSVQYRRARAHGPLTR